MSCVSECVLFRRLRTLNAPDSLNNIERKSIVKKRAMTLEPELINRSTELCQERLPNVPNALISPENREGGFHRIPFASDLRTVSTKRSLHRTCCLLRSIPLAGFRNDRNMHRNAKTTISKERHSIISTTEKAQE
jgi:hypothetical protein